MIHVNDFIRIPYRNELTEGGIAYALRSLPNSFDRTDHSLQDHLRHTVAGAAIELAFRRYLSSQEIPYEGIKTNSFTAPERYDVSLGGRRCELRTFFISNQKQISQITDHLNVMLDAPALVPSDQHAGDGHRMDDLYLFAFVTGRVAVSKGDLETVIETGQPHYLIHVMGDEWRRPRNWNPLGPLTMKSESEDAMLVEVHGQGSDREYITRTYHLPPKTKFIVHDPFHSISALHIKRPATARLGIQRPGSEPHVIDPTQWGNIWVYGMDIYLAGYMSYQEFRRCAKPVPPNTRVFQYHHTRVKNLAVPISQLNPLGRLLESVHEWEEGRNK